MEEQLHSLLTVALAGVESSAAYTGRSQPPEIAPLTTA